MVALQAMGFNRIYTKKRGEAPDLGDPLVIKTDATMEAIVRLLPLSPSLYLCRVGLLTPRLYFTYSATRSTRTSATSSSTRSCVPLFLLSPGLAQRSLTPRRPLSRRSGASRPSLRRSRKRSA